MKGTLLARILYSTQPRDGMIPDRDNRRAGFRETRNGSCDTILHANCAESDTIFDFLLASLVEWLGGRNLAPINNNSNRRNMT
jgi:hypothetical protein